MKKRIYLFVILGFTLLSKDIILKTCAGVLTEDRNTPHTKQNTISWTTAFDNLHEVLSEEYAFTEWKQINWPAIYAEYRPQIESAESANDTAAFFLVLRGYIYSIPDGHMECLASSSESWDFMMNLMEEQVGATYGFALIGLDNGKVVTSIVTDDSPADKAGIRVGAEVLEWNGKPIIQALKEVPEIWGFNPSATNEVRRLRQYRFIGMDQAGKTASITFKNKSEDTSVTAILTAVHDNLEMFWLTHFFPTSQDYVERVQYEILESGYGYVKVTSEGFSSPTNIWVKNKFKEAVKYFVTENVPAIILDLRKNAGGTDEVIPYLAGFFYNQSAHYEHITYYDKASGDFETVATLDIEPQPPYFGGRVVAMVGPGDISSGEGLAMAIQNLPQGQVISFYASNGSFGMAAGNYAMPCDIDITYTNGQSLDIDGIIQIDGDADGNGGVIPDIRVPIDNETVYKKFVEGKDVELDFVIETLDQITWVDNAHGATLYHFWLDQNHPNPFNMSTKIKYHLPEKGEVRIVIYNAIGEKLSTLLNKTMEAGNHEIYYDAQDLPTGLYIYKIQAGQFQSAKKMLVIK